MMELGVRSYKKVTWTFYFQISNSVSDKIRILGNVIFKFSLMKFVDFTNQLLNMLHCKSFEEHFEVKRFVLFSVWTTPGLHILKNKCMKRKEKLKKLFSDTGFYGPIMDVAIRGTISHLMVCNYEKDTKTITDLKEGYLKKFLLKHFECDKLLDTIENLFTKNPQWIIDYENCYRHQRSAIIQSQIMFLTQNPHNLVCINPLHNTQYFLFWSFYFIGF